MTENEKILVACLLESDFELWVDADEWNGLDLATQTARILYAHNTWFRQKLAADSKTEQEKLTEKLQDERLKSLVWRAWLALPGWERDVLRALNATFVETAVPEGTLAMCRTGTNLAKNISPWPRIELDPTKYTEDDDDHTLFAIFHELVHASYRTADIHYQYRDTPVYDELDENFEKFCDELAYQWLKLEKVQREKSHSDNGAAAETAAQSGPKADQK